MARGWESKSVESQQESAETGRHRQHADPLTPEQLQVQREREILELSRVRALHDLEVASNPRYRELLESTIRHLDERIRALG